MVRTLAPGRGGRVLLPLILLLVAPASNAAPAAPDAWLKPDAIVGRLSVESGSKVLLTGPGSAAVLVPLAKRVGAEGTVYVSDADEQVVRALEGIARSEQLTNVVPVVANESGIVLPDKVQKVVLIGAYRSMEGRKTYFSKLQGEMSGGAEIVVIDFYRRATKVGPPVKERVASHDVIREMSRFGFTLVDRHRIVPHQYFLVFRPKRS
jgi:ubiquinone/menaquinone biosynthesis C-methylase UbiE